MLRERRDAKADTELGERVGTGERLKWSIEELDVRANHASESLPLMSVSIDWGVRRRDEVTADEARAVDLSNYKVCRPGDLVINRMRAFQGALGLAPDLEVQEVEVASLRTAVGDIANLIAETERFIELSRERRSALITAAVTCQIEVREAT